MNTQVSTMSLILGLLAVGTPVYADKSGFFVNDAAIAADPNPKIEDGTPQRDAYNAEGNIHKFNLGYPLPPLVYHETIHPSAIQVYKGWEQNLVTKQKRRETDAAMFAAVKDVGKIKDSELLGLASKLEMTVANTRRHLQHLAEQNHIVFDAQAGYYFAR